MLAGIAGWFASGIAKTVVGVFGDTFVKPFLDAWAKSKDIDLEKFRTESQERQILSMALISAEVEKFKTQANVIMAAMNHPIWWVGWALFVIPVAYYNFQIHFVSVFDAWLNTPGCIIPKIGDLVPTGRHLCEWYVRRIPDAQESWDNTIVLSIFGLQLAHGATTGILELVRRKLNRT